MVDLRLELLNNWVLLVVLVVVLELFMDLQLVMEAEIKILLIKMYQTRGILEDMEIILDLRMKTMAVAAVVVPVVLEETAPPHQLEELVVMERQV